MLPNDNTEENARIMVPNELNLASVESLMTGTIVDVANYLPENNNLSYALTDQPRKWYYTQISSLTNIAQEGAAPVYVKQSPWSQQILGGQQIIADDQPPLANIFLVRRALGEQVDEGNELNGYINTTYDLMVEWEDNVEVARNAIISSSGQVLVQNT